MNNSLNNLDACPTADQWRSLLVNVSNAHWTDMEAHLESCSACEATLDAITEQSDTCVRELCRGPSTADDEPVFRQLYNRLVASSDFAFADSAQGLNLQLPYRLGNYELLRPLGHGAHGSVFQARHVPLDREVVVKLLRPDLDFDSASIDRFLQEVRAVGRLNHPHIVRATDAGEMDGRHFLVMEYVPGIDLSSLLSICGPLSAADACEILRQAALGLAYLHHNGFVHRDIKPSNLLLTAAGQVKLLDLGLVQSVREDSDDSQALGKLPHGTADYMSPEQWLAFDDVDSRSDLYGLGCTLGKLLTGAPPFRPLPDGYATKSEAHRKAPVPRLQASRAEIPAAVQSMFERLLAKHPTRRMSSAETLARQLLPLAAGADLSRLARRAGLKPQPIDAMDASSSGSPRMMTRRQAFAAAAVTCAGAALGWAKIQATRRQRAAAHSLETNSWRPLQPATPAVLLPRGHADESLWRRVDDHGFRIQAPHPTLLDFGWPVSAAFRFAVDLILPIGHSHAGLFFQFVSDERDRPSDRFQTVELVPDKVAGKLRHRLVWRVLRVDHGEGRADVTAVLLAAAVLPRETASVGLHSLEIRRGSGGAPQVYWSQQAVDWEFSFEGRTALTDRPRSQRLGRLGIITGEANPGELAAEEGVSTNFQRPRLSYAPSPITA